jgi:hypothetical protein
VSKKSTYYLPTSFMNWLIWFMRSRGGSLRLPI